MNSIKEIIKKFVFKRRLMGRYTFENRKKDSNVLFYVLAGYQPYLWDVVFERVKNFVPQEIDICILSSGIYIKELSELCKKNNWSYFSTKKNKLTLAQNILISKFEKAEWIYKMDEDIFITSNYYRTMMDTYNAIEQQSKYKISFLGPIIPLNSFGTVALLEKLDLLTYYEKQFGKAQYGWGETMKYYSEPNVAKFFWGENNVIPQIDKLDSLLHAGELDYSICPVQFNIGAILFKREFWKDIGMFMVGLGNDLGLDELWICIRALTRSRPFFVAKNTAVGHLSFTPQKDEMKKYFIEHKESFNVNFTENYNE